MSDQRLHHEPPFLVAADISTVLDRRMQINLAPPQSPARGV